MSSNANALPIGARIGEFGITKVLGAGSFGITYEAFDSGLDRHVAIKEFFPLDYARRVADGRIEPSSPDAERVFSWALERFSDEARTLARFSHHNIVSVIQLIPELNGTAYIAMEYLRGTTLEDWVKKAGLPPAALVISIFRQLLSGLAALHANDILHRDIKPSNAMLTGTTEGGTELRPVLIDFGSSRDLALQRTGFSAIVTDGYSPPEQYSRNAKQGPASDIYALAATIYFLVTGEAIPQAAARLTEPLPAIPPARAAEFSPRFLKALVAGLDLDAAKRPQSVAAWRQLLGIDEDGTGNSRGVHISRRTALIAGGGVVAVAAIGGGASYLLTRKAGISGAAAPLRVASTRELGMLGADPFARIVPSKTGAIVGAHRLAPTGLRRMLALRLDDDGTVKNEWLSDADDSEAVTILPAADGGAFVGGRVGPTASLIRLSPSWRQTWRTDRGAGRISVVLPTSKGVVVGIEGIDQSGARIEALGDDGKLVWGLDIDKGKDETVQNMIALAQGGYAVLGWGVQARQTAQGSVNENYTWVALLDDQGKTRNRPQISGAGAASGLAIIEVAGRIYVAGRTSDGKQGSAPKMLLWAINQDGSTAWARWDYPLAPSSGRALAVTPDKALYVAGWAGSPVHMRIAQADGDGALCWDQALETSGPQSAILDLTLRGTGDGFAIATSPVDPDHNKLLFARLTA